MNCGHDQMNIQNFNKKINGFKSINDLAYFLINCSFQIKHKSLSYCFCNKVERQCELGVIDKNFYDLEETIKEVYWISKIELSKDREEGFRNFFVDHIVTCDYPNNVMNLMIYYKLINVKNQIILRMI